MCKRFTGRASEETGKDLRKTLLFGSTKKSEKRNERKFLRGFKEEAGSQGKKEENKKGPELACLPKG